MKAIKKDIVAELGAARVHLLFSVKRAKQIDLSQSLSEEALEILESFTSRFARFTEMMIMQYFKHLVLEKDPGFRGSPIDILNQAEKYGWITSSTTWKRILEMRNYSAHEYSANAVLNLIPEFINLSEQALNVRLDH